MAGIVNMSGSVARLVVLLLTLVAIEDPSFAQEADDFLLIDLKCPAKSNLTLETLQQNRNGERERIRVLMNEVGTIQFAELAAAGLNEDFDAIAISGTDFDDPEALAYARDLLLRAKKAGGIACYGTAQELQTLLDHTRRNRAVLGID